MDFPVLLGREFIKDVAVVDVARENVQGKLQIAGALQALRTKKPLKSSGDKSSKKEAVTTVTEGNKVLTVKKVPIKDEHCQQFSRQLIWKTG